MFLTYFIINSWISSFPNANNPSIVENQNVKPSYVCKTQETYVLDCLFQDLESNDNGGAIATGYSSYILIEYSSFINCKSKHCFGGAVYFSGRKDVPGGSVIEKCCSSNCHCIYQTDSWGQFCRVSIISQNSKNYLNDCSILDINCDITDTHDTLGLYGGIVTLYRNNITNNHINDGAAFGYYNPQKGTIMFSTFSNNTAKKTNIVVLKEKKKFTMDACNFLNNSASNFIYIWGELGLTNTYFKSNTYQNLFKLEMTSTVSLGDCLIDTKFDKGESIIIKSTPKASFINALLYFSTERCRVKEEKPIAVTLTKTHECTDVPLHMKRRVGKSILNVI